MTDSTAPSDGGRPGTLPFERPLEDVRIRLRELEALSLDTTQDLSDELGFYRTHLDRLTREIYDGLSPWDRVQVARHPDRPLTSDFIDGMCSDFVELAGDGYFGDDPATATGLATIGDRQVMIVGQRKGKSTQERVACNFGSSHPEGYRKALRKMRLAERMGLPILCLVNTPGAYPGIGAEERGQARAIAENIFEMFRIRTPIVVVVVGEGGSGGALGIAIGDRIGLMENSWYSVISPEGCASILWKTADRREDAASALKLTAEYLDQFGVVDRVIPEPAGGAHSDPPQAIRLVQEQVLSWFDELEQIPLDQLLESRFQKFRSICR